MQEGKYHAEINERYRGSEKFGYDFFILTLLRLRLILFALDKRLSLVCSDELAGIKSVIVKKWQDYKILARPARY